MKVYTCIGFNGKESCAVVCGKNKKAAVAVLDNKLQSMGIKVKIHTDNLVRLKPDSYKVRVLNDGKC